MSLLPGIETYGQLNGVLLETYAWRTVGSGYDELLNTPALRGGDLVMPGAQGRRPYPRVIDATTISIPMTVTGLTDQDGTATSNPKAALLDHRDYLRNNLGLADDGDADRGTVTFVFTRDDLPDWTGPVTFLGLAGWTTLGRYDALVRLDLSIPDGELAETGS